MERGGEWKVFDEIQNLKKKGLKIAQISRKLKVSRNTVYKFKNMTPEAFGLWIHDRKRKKKLDDMEGFVVGLLKEQNDLSAAQVEDRIREAAPDKDVSAKTVYNFVQAIRKQYDLKVIHAHRSYEKLPQTEYGQQVQIDFGVGYPKRNGTGQKVYFLTMVLSRSRQKFVYFQDHPFCAQEVIHGLKEGFRFFQGLPQEIVLDQDRLMIVDENLGDVITTAPFKAFLTQWKMKLHLCRKNDPQSKGKIENVVKYVKHNFLHGRTYIDIEDLNRQAIAWLKRTANAKIHQTTQKVPAKEWEVERSSLQPVPQEPKLMIPQKLRKDNTLLYKTNYYTVPTGTYQHPGTTVYRKIEGQTLHIYNAEKNHLATHTLSSEKGALIRDPKHLRDYHTRGDRLMQQLEKDFEGQPLLALIRQFFDKIRMVKPRYLCDHIRAFQKVCKTAPAPQIQQTLDTCLQNSIYSAIDFQALLKQTMEESAQKPPAPPIPDPSHTSTALLQQEVEKRDLSAYQKAVES